jgi:formate hydrogenlyase subunit 4
MNTEQILAGLAYLILAPILGGLIAGMDRKITAKMQGRVGPPLFQPFYDVLKLFEKEKVVVSRSQNFYVLAYVVFMLFTGALFFSGGDILLVIFALTLAHVFLVLGAYSVNSPYSYLGAERELIQIMAFEPMIILTTVGMYMVSKLTIEGGSFRVWDIATLTTPVIYYIPGLFLGFIYVLTIKLRKSPFDLSTSHHAHQELVKGLTTEFSGSTLGRIEIAHWYETVLLLGFVYLFFGFNPLLAIAVILIAYFFEIFLDNTSARVKWPLALTSSWAIAAVLGLVNISLLYFINGGGL